MRRASWNARVPSCGRGRLRGLGLLLIALLVGCGGGESASRTAEPSADTVGADETGAAVSAFDWPPPGLEDAPSFEPWSGDLPGMEERRVIRFLTVLSPQYYYIDADGQERGIVFEAAKEFGKQLNERRGRGQLPVFVLVLPVPRDRLIPMIRDGLGDIAAGNLSITPERLTEVDFSIPTYTGVRTLVVTGPGVEAPKDLAALSGRQLYVREATSHWDIVSALSDSLVAAGHEPIDLVPLPGFLESEQVLEMVDAGTIPMTVMDSHIAEFWAELLDGLNVHSDITLSTEGDIGWVFRKDSPALAQTLNDFVRQHRAGTLFGNIMIKRYFGSTERARNPIAGEDRGRFEALQHLFQKYAGEYDFDWLMVAAQAYQESRLDQSVRSGVGAVGVMQILPSTAADIGVQGIDELEANIHAGVKYLRFLHDRVLRGPATGSPEPPSVRLRGLQRRTEPDPTPAHNC